MPLPLGDPFFRAQDAPSIPPQSSPIDPAFGNPLVFGKTWWLALARLFAVGRFLLGNPFVQSGTNAQRLAIPSAQFTDGMIFYVSDRNNIAYQIQAGAWVFLAGAPYRVAQSDLAALRLSYGSAETGLRIEVQDYRHVLRWTGTAFTWGPGEDGRHDIAALPIDPDDSTGWSLCDGSTVSYLKGDGTLGSFVTPDLIGAGAEAYLKFGDTVSGPNAATAPTFTPPTVDAAATGITLGASNSNVIVTVGGAPVTTLAMGNHMHPVTDPTHTHTLSGGSVGADGEPANLELRPYFRR